MKIGLQILFLFFVIAIFSDCIGRKEEKETLINEYIKRYSEADSPFAAEDIIISTIAYTDEIISKKGNKYIKSIYYDKARLLFKLKRYNEALDALFKTDNDESYDIYIATLFIKLSRSDEADPYVQRLIGRQKKAIIEFMAQANREKDSEKIKQKHIKGLLAIQGLMVLYICTDRTYESILHEFTSENIITYDEADTLLQEILSQTNTQQGDMQKTKEILLNNMWSEIENIR
jgi:tetratricopeptide (TPR) repeat protein